MVRRTQLRRRQQHDADEWLRTLYAGEPAAGQSWAWGPAGDLLTMRHAGKSFRRAGLDAVLPVLASHVVDPPVPGPAALRQLRRAAWRSRVLSRLLFGPQPCLFECVTVAARLRRRGLDAQIVVGRLSAPIGAMDEVHAWLEYGGGFVDGDMLYSHYTEVARYPRLVTVAAGR